MADNDEACDHDGRLAVRYDVLVAHGDEAKLLQRRQSEAVQALLVWLAEQDDGDTGSVGDVGVDDV